MDLSNKVLKDNIDFEKNKEFYFEKDKKLVADLGKKLGRTPTAAVITFGCQMNARDSEKLIGILIEAGFTIIEDESADFVLYNTCTVRDNANQKVYGHLGIAGGYKKKNPYMKIGLCGCMMQEPSVIEKIKSSYRFVNLIFGTHNIHRFPEYLASVLEQDDMIIDIWKEGTEIDENLPVSRKYSFKSGVNIMFGCNNFCTYCIVPYVRGRERSRDAKEIIRECEKLASEGVVEVMLLGQNVNSYGKGIEDGITFPQLLQEIEKIDGIKRIRFMTSHPKDLSEELIQVMKNSKKICRHLHLPLQSGSSRLLKQMNRCYDKDKYVALAKHIREEIPDIAMTTDIIVGFPGETDADIEDTLDVIRQVQYDNAFTFIYSKRTGTPAASFENQIPEAESHRQFDKVLKLVQETARQRAAVYQGMTMEALVEEMNENDPTLVSGRLSNNMIVHFSGDESMIGKFYNVRLNECKGFYYLGEIVDK